MRRILTFLLTITLLFCLVPTVSAHDVPELDRLGSIELIVSYDGKPVSGGTLTAIRVGDVGEDDGNYFFRSLMDGTILLPSEVQTSATAFEMADRVDNYVLETWEEEIPASGIVKFEKMKTGLYLILQNEPSPGYYALAPFLVSLPYMENGEYRYDVTAKIKSELDKEPEPTTQPPPTCPDDPTCPTTKPTTPKPTSPTPTTKPPGPTNPTKPSTPGKLPQTGQLTWPIPVMTSAGLALFIFGWILCFCSRRKERYEE